MVINLQVNSVSIIVPIYNEKRTAETLFHELVHYASSYKIAEIIVVESGSTDGTREIVEDCARNLPPEVFDQFKFIYESKAKGKGSACRLGILNSSKDTSVIFDADLEYSLSDVSKLVNVRLATNSKIVLGSRHKKNQPMRTFNQSKWRSTYFNLGHILITSYFNLLCQTNLRDPATMWKVVDGNLARSLQFKSDKFDFDWELLIAFIRLGHIPEEVDIVYSSRSPNEGKKIRPIRDPIHWIIRIAYFRFSRIP